MSAPEPAVRELTMLTVVNAAWTSEEVGLDAEVLTYRSITSGSVPTSKFWKKLAQHVFDGDVAGLHASSKRKAPLSPKHEQVVIDQLRAAAPRLLRAVRHHKVLVSAYKEHIREGGAPYLSSMSDSIEGLWAAAWEKSASDDELSPTDGKFAIRSLASRPFSAPAVKALLQDPAKAAEVQQALDRAWSAPATSPSVDTSDIADTRQLRQLFSDVLAALGPAKVPDMYGRVPWLIGDLPSLSEQRRAQRQAFGQPNDEREWRRARERARLHNRQLRADASTKHRLVASARGLLSIDDDERATFLDIAQSRWRELIVRPEVDVMFRPESLGLIGKPNADATSPHEGGVFKPYLFSSVADEGWNTPILERSIYGRVRSITKGLEFDDRIDTMNALIVVVDASARPYGLPTRVARALFLLGAIAAEGTVYEVEHLRDRERFGQGIEDGGAIDYFRRRLFSTGGLAKYLRVGGNDGDSARRRLATFSQELPAAMWRRALRESVRGVDLTDIEQVWKELHEGFVTALRRSSVASEALTEIPDEPEEGPSRSDREKYSAWVHGDSDAIRTPSQAEESFGAVSSLRRRTWLSIDVLRHARRIHGEDAVNVFLRHVTSGANGSAQRDSKLAETWFTWVESFVDARIDKSSDDATSRDLRVVLRRRCGSFEHLRQRLVDTIDATDGPEAITVEGLTRASQAHEVPGNQDLYSVVAILGFARAQDDAALAHFTSDALAEKLSSQSHRYWADWTAGLATQYQRDSPDWSTAIQHRERMPNAAAAAEYLRQAYQSPNNPNEKETTDE